MSYVRFDHSLDAQILQSFRSGDKPKKIAEVMGLRYANVRQVIVRNDGLIRKKTPNVPEILPPIPLSLLLPHRPITAFEFHTKQKEVTKTPQQLRADAGEDPLPPFHPIARAALPVLHSLIR